jgi:hypothetical protein
MKRNVNNILNTANYYHDIVLKKIAITGGEVAIGFAISFAVMGALNFVNKLQRESGLKDNLEDLLHNFDEYMSWSSDEDIIVKYKKDFDELKQSCIDMQKELNSASQLSEEQKKDPASLKHIEDFLKAAYVFETLYMPVRGHIEENMNVMGKAMHFINESFSIPYMTDSVEFITSLDDTYKYLSIDKIQYQRILDNVKEELFKQQTELNPSNLLGDKSDATSSDPDEQIAKIKI